MITDDRSFTSTPAGLNAPRVVVTTAPGSEPVTFAQQQAFTKDIPDDEQTATEALITSARRLFEAWTGQALINTVFTAYWDALPRSGTYRGAPVCRELELPRAPLVSVASVKYRDDVDGTEQTFDSANYTVEAGLDPKRFSRLWLDSDADWPDLGDYPGALRCTFTAGYGADATGVPAEIKTAIMMLVTHFYENRLPVAAAQLHELPFSLQAIIGLHTIRTIV